MTEPYERREKRRWCVESGELRFRRGGRRSGRGRRWLDERQSNPISSQTYLSRCRENLKETYLLRPMPNRPLAISRAPRSSPIAPTDHPGVHPRDCPRQKLEKYRRGCGREAFRSRWAEWSCEAARAAKASESRRTRRTNERTEEVTRLHSG